MVKGRELFFAKLSTSDIGEGFGYTSVCRKSRIL